MKNVISLVPFIILAAVFPSQAADLKEQVKVETASVGLHPGMDPGMYVCAANHLHIKASVQNLAKVRLGRVKVAGKVLGADGKVLGTAVAWTKRASLAPGEKAEVNIEFLTVTGPTIERVKKHELAVVEAMQRK